MRAVIILGLAIACLAMLAAAFGWDSVRTLEAAYDRAMAAEREVRNQEERFLSVLPALGIGGPALDAAIGNYRETQDGAARRRAFQDLLARIGALQPTDPTDPIARRAADEYAGAQNRRQIALRHYQDAAAAYNRLARGIRGQVGRMLGGLPEALPE